MKLPSCNRLSFRFLLTALFLLFFLFINPFSGNHACHGKEITVELVWKFQDAGWIQIQVEQGQYTLKEVRQGAQSGTFFEKGSRLEMTWGGWTPVLRKNYDEFRIWRESKIELIAQSANSVFQIRTPDGQKASYRGSLEISWDRDHWKLINRLDSEDYLKGVVPIEMSNQWARDGLEALKAQAIAARTYMMKKTQTTTKITDSPNIDQAYLGINVEGAATHAVEETRGEILVDSITGTPIDALYSSHNGGYSEYAENVWSNQDPHFPSQPDPFSEGIGGAADRWRFIIGADYLGKTFEMAPITKVELDKFPSGRVKEVRMLDIYGKEKKVSGRAFVQKFYPFGQPIKAQAFLGSLFDVREISGSGSEVSVSRNFAPVLFPKVGGISGPRLNRIMSSAQGIREIPSPYDTYIFNGRGWGHGVGMSQWGAYHMAQQGYTYQEILEFYYDQMKIVKNMS